MADPKIKPAIPSWQRANPQQPLQSHGKPPTTPADDAAAKAEEIPTEKNEESIVNAGEPAGRIDAAKQLNEMRSFLLDPTVKSASVEKKRAFFESKGIPAPLIDQVLDEQTGPSIQLDDWKSFQESTNEASQQQQQRQQPAQSQQQQQQQQQQIRQAGLPPIITYPEFLVDAHKPPPIITFSRIVNAAYAVGGLTALVYGASKYLVAPMSASLTDSRHDFASHTQAKLDEMNERLAQIASTLPGGQKQRDALQEPYADDTSDDGEPTELFQRDMGTQTSPGSSRRSSSVGLEDPKRDNLEYSLRGVGIIKSHLDEMLERTKAVETANQERHESVSKLRHYVDTLIYTSPNAGLWLQGENSTMVKDEKKKAPDAVEELKKDIRSVKGVLLSAKRFPSTLARVGA